MNLELSKIFSLIPPDIRSLTETFHENNYECYPVGGAVRDLLSGHKPEEWDFASNARPEEVRKLFPHVIPTGIQHGTVTVMHQGRPCEITTYRIEGKYTDKRRPDRIEYAKTLDEDLSRRDFTINGMALDLQNKKLIDLFEGQTDLKNRIIKTIGDPEIRFGEDALRMMRACRFASTLGFHIDDFALNAIQKQKKNIHLISKERIRDELIKILFSKKPSIGIELLRMTGLLEILIPELLEGHGIEQNKYHKFDIYYHNLETCDAAARILSGRNVLSSKNESDRKNCKLSILLSALLHDAGKARSLRKSSGQQNTFYNHEMISRHIARKILKQFRFSNQVINLCLELVRNHMFHYTIEWTDGAVRRFIRKTDGFMEELFILRESDRLGSGKKQGYSKIIEKLKKKINTIIDEDNAFKVTDLVLTGHDVMTIKNIPPSPRVGKILEELLQACLDDPSQNTVENLTKLVEKSSL